MAKIKLNQTNWTAGEWSPLLEGRVDLDKYFNSAYKLENFLIYPHGPAQTRPGFRFIHPTKDNGIARLIPFEFSTEQAYQLEFGDNYIRFYKDQAIITYTTKTITGATQANPVVITSASHGFSNADRVIISNVSGMVELNNREFIVANATANTFELSGINGTSYGAYISGGTVAKIYEVSSPYNDTDLGDIKYTQSADVLYLFHPDYQVRKLSRAGDTSWTLTTINFNPPATDEDIIKPNATLTPNAVSGNFVTFTASASVFQTGDVGRVIVSGVGKASIVDYQSGTVVVAAITDNFASTAAIASGSWSLEGSPTGTLTPSAQSPVGAIITLPCSGAAETFTELLEADVNHWALSGGGTNEYYLKNTAPFYSTVQPSKVYLDGVDSGAPGTLGALLAGKHGWGNNDTLGYNTIYVRLSDGTDPDSKSTTSTPNNSYVKRSQGSQTKEPFRSADKGKYIRLHSGFVKITQYDSKTQVKGQIIKELSAVTGTTAWTLENTAWNATDGYPICGTFFEDRFILAGNDTYPETVWGSVVGDYENFTSGAADDDAISFTLSGKKVNEILWIEPGDTLIGGTPNGPHRIGASTDDAPLVPTDVLARQKATRGCADILPITIDEAILYVQAAGRKILEFVYDFSSDSYKAPDLTRLAEHISKTGIVEVVYQQEPLSIIWCRRTDGVLIGLTYLRPEEVIGWHRHPTDGVVESISVIPGNGYDELWAIIKRNINGSDVRYVEALEKIFDDTSVEFDTNNGLNAFCVDSGLTYNGSSTTTISGLWHLNGETVSILADGAVKPSQVVNNGKLTLSQAATVVHVGLPYTAKLQKMRSEYALQDGSSQGRFKRSIGAIIRLWTSGTFKAGIDEDNLDTVLLQDADMPMGSPPTLFTGDKRISIDGKWKRDNRITIVQDKPVPLTVIAIMEDEDVNR